MNHAASSLPRVCFRYAFTTIPLFLSLTGCHPKPTLPYGPDMQAAIESGNLATVKMLLDTGVDPNGKGDHKNTPLTDAMDAMTPLHPERIEVVKLLLKAGAKPDIPDAVGLYPLNSAAGSEQDNAEAVQLLVKAGANVNTFDQFGETPLISAFKQGQAQSADYLMEHGAELNPDSGKPRSESPLGAAISRSNSLGGEKFMLALIQKGARLKPAECKDTLSSLRYKKQPDTYAKIASTSPCKEGNPKAY